MCACGSTTTISSDSGQASDFLAAPDIGSVDGLKPAVDGKGPLDDTGITDALPMLDIAVSVCGDGLVEGNEQCDEGAFNSDLPDAPCRSDCSVRRCGDSIIDAVETCDDGNNSAGDGCDANCQTEGGSLLRALPNPLHFGSAIIGCSGSVGAQIQLYNASKADISIASVTLLSCGPEIVIGGVIPQAVPKAGVAAIDMVFLPSSAGVSNCIVEVVADGVVYIPVTAEALAKGPRDDLFQQQLNRKVDFLFVLDGGGSMQDSLQGLQQSGQMFLNALSSSKVDFHIGFVQLAPETPQDEGLLQGDPSYLTPNTNNLYKLFVDGFTPKGGVIESGFDAMTTALSPPLTATLASDCTACAAPNKCVDGACRGANWGFRRSGASLEVLLVTDEEEQSVALAKTVETFLRNLINPLLAEFVRVHVLIPVSQCAEGRLFEKYNAIAANTGGVINDLCLPNFPAAFQSLADRTFGLLDQFRLLENPKAGSLKVSVDGINTSGFVYHAPSNTITLTPAPADGSVITASYDPVCP